jgi:hypothetical protein
MKRSSKYALVAFFIIFGQDILCPAIAIVSAKISVIRMIIKPKGVLFSPVSK